MLRRPMSAALAAALVITVMGLTGATPATASNLTNNILAWGDSDNANEIQSTGAVGDNFYGQKTVPASLSNKLITQVSAGAYNSGALDSTGAVTIWGYASGPDGTSTPPAFLANHPAKQISVGQNVFMALTATGRIVQWGYFDSTEWVVPAALATLTAGGETGGSKTVDAIDTSYGNALAISGGDVYAWGINTYGQNNVPAAIAPGGSKEAVKIASASYFSMALDSEGTVYVWGNVSVGNPNYDLSVPSSVNNVNITDIAARGQGGLMALDSDGHVHTWGSFVPAVPTELAPGGSTTVAKIAIGDSSQNYQKSYGVVTSTGETIMWGLDGTADAPGQPSASNAAYVPPNVSSAHVTSISMSGQVQLAVVQPEIEQSGIATVSGSPVIGQTLTAGAPTYTPSDATPTYQWLAGGNPIANATGPQHYLSSADAGQAISVRVTGTKTGYASSAELTSSSTTAVSLAPSTTVFSVVRNKKKKATFKIYVAAPGVSPAAINGEAVIYRGKKKLKKIKTLRIANGYVSWKSGKQPKGKQYYRIVFKGTPGVGLPSATGVKSVKIK